ncbi:MAG: T9SS type A sorting domain-containing protein [Bacteroidetes bacterium]|nr:T9SS type A sorting domain-containing protein [Bacteroidota bacterium]
MSDTLFVNNLTINAGSVFSTTTNASSNNTIAPVTIASGGAVIINGTFKTGKTAGFVASLNFLSSTPNYTLGSNSTIVFDKVSTGTAQNINALQYVNLTIAGASPKSFDVGLIKVSGNFKYTNTGAINVAPSTFELNGTSTQSFDGIPAPFFGNTIFSGGGKKILSSDATIAGAISLIAGTVDVDVYKLNLLQSATIGAGSNSSYFVTGNNGLGRVLVSSPAATAITIPVGSPNNYLPVIMLPDSVSSYSLAAFDGLTVDGTYGAALVDAATKSESVDAFWDITRTIGTGNVLVKTSWPPAIEGANFNAASNAQIGLLHYTGAWVSGTNAIADNALNSASATFSSFSPFAVSKIGGLLPVSKIDLQLAKLNNDVNIIWKTVGEKNTKSFVIEKSTNGVEFIAINTVDAKNTINENVYSIVDKNVNAIVVYYRIKIIDVNGKSSYSNVATIKMNGKHSFEIIANPIINKELKVQINNLPKGNYTIEILNSLGQKKQQINLTSNSTSVSQTILLNNTISNGLYFVRLSGIDIDETKTVIVK